MASSYSIPYRPRDFSAGRWPHLQTPGNLAVADADLVRAAITVGKPGQFYRGPVSRHVALEFGYRALILAANFEPDARVGGLVQTEAYALLDSSEKGAVSYFLGLAVAKLFAEAFFDTPWLQHLALFSASLPPSYWALKNRRPDLVGLDCHRNWVVIEAKGRSGTIPTALLESAKHQTRCLRSLGGQLPTLRAVVAGGFRRSLLTVELRDPVEPTDEAVDIDLSPSDFLEVYYAPIRAFLEQAENRTTVLIGDENYVIAALPDADLYLGLRSSEVGWPVGKESVPIRTWIQDLHLGEPSIGQDGAVCLMGASWVKRRPV